MSLKDAFLFNLQSETHLRDARHANQIYTQNNFAFSPKTKYMYHVRFDPNEEIGNNATSNVFRFQKELGILVKSADLPSFRASVENKQQYNRKKNVQTRVDYQPVQLRMHDDNLGLTTMLMEAYYRYYFNDSNITTIEDSYHPRGTYQEVTNGLRYGLDNSRRFPFFKDIKLYQFARHEYTEYTLVNPMISQWGHDTMNQSETTGIAENAMTLVYENVLYDRGAVGEDSPATFATTHYDKSPSPLGVGGGGVNSLFGDGGVLGGIGSILGDINSGNFGLGTIIKGVNVFKNAKNLSKDSIKNEGLSLLEGAAINALNNTVNGVPGTKFPKASGAGGALSTTKATQAASQASEETTKAKVDAAKAANNIGGP